MHALFCIMYFTTDLYSGVGQFGYNTFTSRHHQVLCVQCVTSLMSFEHLSQLSNSAADDYSEQFLDFLNDVTEVWDLGRHNNAPCDDPNLTPCLLLHM